jgi:FAD dependent oxidoreductase TIGR03364
MTRVVVVGAGIVGTMHAWWARRKGHEVVHLDRDAEPRRATVRNFGLIWVSGRAIGDELDLALRARQLWEQLGRQAPDIGFRPDGSLTLAQLPEEVHVLEEVVNRADAPARELQLLSADQVREINPALRGEFLAGLLCGLDAVVEPGAALPAIRKMLAADDGYRFVGGRTVTEVHRGHVLDHLGVRHETDLVIVCPGAEMQGPMAQLLVNAPLRRVRLQMMQTEPLGETLTTSVADGDSLRYYPAFRVPALDRLPPQRPVAAAHHMQLLISQRATGALTIGDTHDYDEPFDFAVDEAPYEHLRERAESLLGRELPPIVRRWAGVYSQALHEAICWRDEVQRDVWVVTGPGGRGMTLSPAIAEETWNVIDSNAERRAAT